MNRVPKLSDYIETAAADFLRETGRVELDARWIAEFFQDSGVAEAYPRQDLVAFSVLVEKALAKHAERAGKQARLHLDRIAKIGKKPPRA
ncbi:MAG: hypothetical protein Q7J47_21995 [Azoarcus sp.]|nr:hypothetical protein [Azoarcus sp.]